MWKVGVGATCDFLWQTIGADNNGLFDDPPTLRGVFSLLGETSGEISLLAGRLAALVRAYLQQPGITYTVSRRREGGERLDSRLPGTPAYCAPGLFLFCSFMKVCADASALLNPSPPTHTQLSAIEFRCLK